MQFMRRISSLFYQRIVVGGLAAFFAVALLFSRRSQTITSPQVWSEDGRYIIPQFINHGWLSLLEPVNGYLVFISRFISNTTLTLVPESYPLASTLLSWFFTAIVAAYIAIAPTLLKKRLLLAMSCFVVPVDPEVFGIPLYAFWWAGLVLLTIPLWQLSSRYFKFRLITLFVCGLSSPLVVLIAPLLALRAYYLRYRSDYLLFLLSIICSAIQLHYILLGNANTSMSQLSWSKIIKIIEKFFGYFITNIDVNFFGSFVYAGAFLLALVSFSIFTSRDRWVNVVLGYYLFGTILLSITRVPIDSIHPVFSGQRYFFYPYVLIAWIFIQGMNFSSRFIYLKFLSFLLVTVLSLSIYNISRTGWSRENGDIEWSKNIESCTHFDEYKIPIHTDGHLANVWRENYSKEICKFLATKKKNPSESLYPFTVEDIEIYLSDK